MSLSNNGPILDSNLRYRLSPTLSQQPLRSVIISCHPNPVRDEPSVSRPHLYRRTAPTVEPTIEKVTIEMDNCSASDRKVSATKKQPNPVLDIVDQITSRADRDPHARCSASPKTTSPTVEPTKEKATIKMDDSSTPTRRHPQPRRKATRT